MSEPYGVDVGKHDWMQDALCSQTDPDLWFDPGRSLEAAVACQRCPVLEQCAEYAVGYSTQYGVIGGMTPAERRRARKLGVSR